MPWLSFNRPSIAIATLAAFVKEQEPGIDVRCRSEHVRVWQELQEEYERVTSNGLLPELIYIRHLYPDRDQQAREAIVATARAVREAQSWGRPAGTPKMQAPDIERLLAVTGGHLEATAEQLANEVDVVGLSTVYSQLFASLCLARAVKQRNPAVTTVFGGTAASTAGPSLLNEYDFVDYLVTGEGELRLLELLRQLRAGAVELAGDSGILSQGTASLAVAAATPACASLAEITDLDHLPLPDFDEFHELSDELSILPLLPIEGSRGCWWEQRRPGRGTSGGCFFCGLNSKSSRRDKSVERISEEMKVQAARYEGSDFVFTDNLVRSTGRRKMAKALLNTGIDLRFNLEVRADIKAADLVAMRRAGCTGVQIGVEGLSTSYLRRLNKGTTTMQNLYTMRACYELDLRSGSNLLTGFPQATQAEVEETVNNILRYAVCYEPLNISRYSLDRNSRVFRDPAAFGITRIVPNPLLQQALPQGTAERLDLQWLEYEVDGEAADWAPVLEACAKWRELHLQLRDNDAIGVPRPLVYFDSGASLQVIDRRFDFRTLSLGPAMRELYLYCMEIRSLRQIVKRFADLATEQQLCDLLLRPLLEQCLLYQEGSRFLSLAVAWRPDVAARRIMAA